MQIFHLNFTTIEKIFFFFHTSWYIKFPKRNSNSSEFTWNIGNRLNTKKNQNSDFSDFYFSSYGHFSVIFVTSAPQFPMITQKIKNRRIFFPYYSALSASYIKFPPLLRGRVCTSWIVTGPIFYNDSKHFLNYLSILKKYIYFWSKIRNWYTALKYTLYDAKVVKQPIISNLGWNLYGSFIQETDDYFVIRYVCTYQVYILTIIR